MTAGEALAALSGQFQLHQGEGAGGAAGRAKLGRWGEGGGEAGGPIPASPLFPPFESVFKTDFVSCLVFPRNIIDYVIAAS